LIALPSYLSQHWFLALSRLTALLAD